MHTYPFGYVIALLKVLCVFVSVPSKPLNLTVLEVSSDSISLSWLEPERANGAIDGYRIYFMYNNYTDVKSVKAKRGSPSIDYNLKNLSKFYISEIPMFTLF